jgi:hypothetical protein
MPVPIWYGTAKPLVTGGAKLDLHRALDFGSYLRGLAGKPLEIIVRRRRAQRSHAQNAFYWGVVIAITAEYCGYEPDEMHEAWKLDLLTVHDEGKPLPRVRSTTDLSTAEFEDYVERIRRKAAEMGCDVPEPNEVAA